MPVYDNGFGRWDCPTDAKPIPLLGHQMQYAPNPMPRPIDQITIPYTPPQAGCICPPGANKDCESPMCPRQNHLKMKE